MDADERAGDRRGDLPAQELRAEALRRGELEVEQRLSAGGQVRRQAVELRLALAREAQPGAPPPARGRGAGGRGRRGGGRGRCGRWS
ncbi:MAG: hypothetical protein KJ058_07540, partial [Thermoanaerobaculia bacterium]|nr:hypothetical protein [Thermoanaerobaculia bacterium]